MNRLEKVILFFFCDRVLERISLRGGSKHYKVSYKSSRGDELFILIWLYHLTVPTSKNRQWVHGHVGLVPSLVLFCLLPDGYYAWILYMQENLQEKFMHTNFPLRDGQRNHSTLHMLFAWLCHFVDWHDCTIIWKIEGIVILVDFATRCKYCKIEVSIFID